MSTYSVAGEEVCAASVTKLELQDGAPDVDSPLLP